MRCKSARRSASRILACLTLGLSLPLTGVRAEEITVAAATNFAAPLAALRSRFERDSGHRLIVSSGSSGQLYAQIVNGAPYDVFLSADEERPRRLEAEGRAVDGTRFTYAVGRLVLWTPAATGTLDGDTLHSGGFRHLALANPRLAPYGLAARQTLEGLGLWESLQDRIVLGENIGQTYSLAATGNAELAFVALAQVRGPGTEAAGALWEVPETYHEPILQQAVLVRDGEAARAFLDFLRSAPARALIEDHGYSLDASGGLSAHGHSPAPSEVSMPAARAAAPIE